jgi:tRNA pseudouridine38-40 synthase
MYRYFIEVAYKGTQYAGFQIQPNAVTIQKKVQEAFSIYFKQNVALICSSRTDAGVHALKNIFHFDSKIHFTEDVAKKGTYSINAILPNDIVVLNFYQVELSMHARFSPVSRLYEYHIYQTKNPFLLDRAYYFPFKLNIDLLNQAANCILNNTDFSAFSKKNTQVHTNNCKIYFNNWTYQNNLLIYKVEGNRFLRGMVRGLVGTMLKVGTQKMSLNQFINIIHSKDQSKADFSTPPQGLYLIDVKI